MVFSQTNSIGPDFISNRESTGHGLHNYKSKSFFFIDLLLYINITNYYNKDDQFSQFVVVSKAFNPKS